MAVRGRGEARGTGSWRGREGQVVGGGGELKGEVVVGGEGG